MGPDERHGSEPPDTNLSSVREADLNQSLKYQANPLSLSVRRRERGQPVTNPCSVREADLKQRLNYQATPLSLSVNRQRLEAIVRDYLRTC